MILPIFITSQFLSVKTTEKGTKHKLVNLFPVTDHFLPVISISRIRELLKGLLNEDVLTDIKPIILSIAPDNFDIEPEYDFQNVLSTIPFPVIVPEYYYPAAIDALTPGAANRFLNSRKYGIEIPEDIKIQIDSAAIQLYIKENIGKFISQNQIVISTSDVDSKFRDDYIEAVIKIFSDNIQIAGVWKIFIDFDYSLFPNLIEILENEVPVGEFFEDFAHDVHGKLIIAPGVKEIQIGENDNFEKLDLTDQNLNKFKIKEDDKITFKWKSAKSKFDGEIYGSKTGIRIDVRERT